MLSRIQQMPWAVLGFLAAVILATLCAAWFLTTYFSSFYARTPAQKVYAMESGWEYETPREPRAWLGTLEMVKPGDVAGGETLTLYHTLNSTADGMSLLVRTKHQTLRVLVNGEAIYERGYPSGREGRDPGMNLHLIRLPADCGGMELHLELCSPYTVYSGRVGRILLGTPEALDAAVASTALRPVMFMAISLFLGFCTIGLAFAQGIQGTTQWKHLAIGVFAVDWGAYCLCNQDIVLQFFTTAQASLFSLGCYYFMQAPLSLFFCCSFRHYRRAMIPAVWAHGAFVAAAFALHTADLTDLPALVNANNMLLAAGLLYILLLCALEVRRGNRFLWVSAPFLALAWSATVIDFYYFYCTRQPMRYLFLDPFFLLISATLAHSVLVFFRQYYRERKEGEIQAVQLQAALESYALEREHNERLRALKHEFNKHMAAARLYMKTDKQDEAVEYLDGVSGDYRDLRLSAHCDNLLVNALVGRMLRRAHGIDARVELKLDDIEPVGMDDNELFGLLSNLLDNALEACAKTPEGERYIHLTIRRHSMGLLVVCENSRKGLLLREGDGYRTTKPDSENHGHGLPEIRRFAGRYQGVLDIRAAPHSFCVSVLVHDMAKQANTLT